MKQKTHPSNMKTNYILLPIIAITMNLTILGAQSAIITQEQKDKLIESVGKDAGEALYTTHFAVNALADNWQNNVYAEFQAKELAASYKATTEKVYGMVKGKSAKIEQGSELLVKQATVLENWINTKDMNLASSYRQIKTEADAALFSDGQVNASVEAEIKQIAEDIRNDMANLAKYKPTLEQIKSIIFTTVGAQRLHQYTETGFSQLPAGKPAAKPGQTDVIVVGPDLKDLPGGYTTTKDHFKEGVQIYGFKYVEPGQTIGTAYDALFKVDGKWVFIPKPWRIFTRPTSPGQQ